ncbi:hypothetical protein [Azospirillum sp. Marseille-Q6669]
MPETEQFAIGGLYATRGYTLNNGSVDTGFVLRSEARLPTFPSLGHLESSGFGPVEDVVSPFPFPDVGYGHNYNYDALPGIGERADTTPVGGGGWPRLHAPADPAAWGKCRSCSRRWAGNQPWDAHRPGQDAGFFLKNPFPSSGVTPSLSWRRGGPGEPRP